MTEYEQFLLDEMEYQERERTPRCPNGHDHMVTCLISHFEDQAYWFCLACQEVVG